MHRHSPFTVYCAPFTAVMPKGGLEPPRACAHCALNAARLPIPPLRRGRKRSAHATLASSSRLTHKLLLAYHLQKILTRGTQASAG